MKKIIGNSILALSLLISGIGFSQDAGNVVLEQTDGQFTVQELHLAAGDYVFEIVNNGVDHEIGFVIAPEGQTDAEHHIKEAYVTAPVQEGSSSQTSVVTLKPGTYVYFCPLNPTPEYKLIVN